MKILLARCVVALQREMHMSQRATTALMSIGPDGLRIERVTHRFSFVVEGPPVPKGRPRLGKGGRVYTPEKTVKAEQAWAWAARAAVPRGWPLDAKYRLVVRFYFADNRRRDLDNAIKVSDGLNPRKGGKPFIWNDDSQVVAIEAQRFLDRARPRTEVTIEALS